MTEEQQKHGEALFLAFTTFLDPQGQKWSLTLREGAEGPRAVEFMQVCTTVTGSLVENGFRPIDQRSPIEWPPKSEQDRIKELVEREARQFAREIANKEKHDFAVDTIVQYAIKLGIMNDPDDVEGKKRVVEIGKEHKLAVGEMGSKLSDWMIALSPKQGPEKTPEKKPEKTPEKKPEKKTPPSTRSPGVRPVPQDITQNLPEGGGAVYVNEIHVVANADGSPFLQFKRSGDRWPRETYYPDAAILFDNSEDLQEHADLADLTEIGNMISFPMFVLWEPSEKLNQKGNPYHNVYKIVGA